MAALKDAATGYSTVDDSTDTAPAYPLTGSGTTLGGVPFTNFTGWTSFQFIADGITLLDEARQPEYWGIVGA